MGLRWRGKGIDSAVDGSWGLGDRCTDTRRCRRMGDDGSTISDGQGFGIVMMTHVCKTVSGLVIDGEVGRMIVRDSGHD